MATNLTAAQIIRRAQALLADANNDDEVEAELRADLVRIDETLAFINDYRDDPQLAAEIENLERLRAKGIAMLLLHRRRRMHLITARFWPPRYPAMCRSRYDVEVPSFSAQSVAILCVRRPSRSTTKIRCWKANALLMMPPCTFAPSSP